MFFKRKEGLILITVLGVMMVTSILILALFQSTLANLNFASRQIKSIIAMNAAEAGIAMAVYELESDPDRYINVTGNLSNGVGYDVTIQNNINEPNQIGEMPPYSIKLTSVGYARKFKRTVETILRPRSLQLGLASNGPVDMNDAFYVKVNAVPGYTGNIHANGGIYPEYSFNADIVWIDLNLIIFHINLPFPPFYDVNGKVTGRGRISNFIKTGVEPPGNYNDNSDPNRPVAEVPLNFTEWTFNNLKANHSDPNEITPPAGNATYRVENGNLNYYLGGVLGPFPVTDTLPPGVTCNGNTLTAAGPLKLRITGDITIEDSNFYCPSLTQVIVEKPASGMGSGNMVVKDTNFYGKTALIVEGKLTFEGYSNISGLSTDGLAIYSGDGMDIHMQPADPNFADMINLPAAERKKHTYYGVIYSDGPINLYNEGCRGLLVDGSVVSTYSNGTTPSISFQHDNSVSGFGKLGYCLEFKYDPDYTQNLIITSPGPSGYRYDRVYWHVY